MAPKSTVIEFPLPSSNRENTKTPALPEDSVHNRSRPADQPTPIQAVKAVLRSTPEQQEIQKEAPDISLEQPLSMYFTLKIMSIN